MNIRRAARMITLAVAVTAAHLSTMAPAAAAGFCNGVEAVANCE